MMTDKRLFCRRRSQIKVTSGWVDMWLKVTLDTVKVHTQEALSHWPQVSICWVIWLKPLLSGLMDISRFRRLILSGRELFQPLYEERRSILPPVVPSSSFTIQNPVFTECCSVDISRLRIQLLSCHDLIFLWGTSCFLTPLPFYRPKSVGQS